MLQLLLDLELAGGKSLYSCDPFGLGGELALSSSLMTVLSSQFQVESLNSKTRDS